ncbi:PRC-barrel domain-containing protein [Phosphitispora sp. TUW77]|uniref:PRC-barrel domain-containing protein n=1 Tax=Phosphitispora sp. TUW77 TaxID=3152361 RepID=UPI003AB83886
MLKGRGIISQPVIALNSGKQVGEVKDLIYDIDENRVIGYLVENGGWLRNSKGFLHKEIFRHENESLIIIDESVIKPIKYIPALKEIINDKRDIRGLRVESDNGQSIGIIQDLIIDENTGEITGYEISDGVIEDLLKGRFSIPNTGVIIGQDRIIASTEINGIS